MQGAQGSSLYGMKVRFIHLFHQQMEKGRTIRRRDLNIQRDTHVHPWSPARPLTGIGSGIHRATPSWTPLPSAASAKPLAFWQMGASMWRIGTQEAMRSTDQQLKFSSPASYHRILDSLRRASLAIGLSGTSAGSPLFAAPFGTSKCSPATFAGWWAAYYM
jgi:hypothetical protein